MKNISDKIFDFLKEEKRGITTREIGEKFFNIKSINKASEIIVEKTLKNDPKFIKIENLWKINPSYKPEGNIFEKELCFLIAQKFKPNLKEEFFLTSLIKISLENLEKKYFLISDNSKIVEEREKYLESLIPDKFSILSTRKFISEVKNGIRENTPVIFSEIGGKNFLKILETGGIFFKEIIKLSSFLKSFNLDKNFLRRENREIEVIDITESIYEKIDFIKELFEKNSIETLSNLKDFISLKSEPFDFSEKKFNEKFLKELPSGSGVYFFLDRKGEIIYIGKSKNLKRRVSSYFSRKEKEEEKLIKIQKLTYEINLKKTESEFEAILEEAYLIKKIKPAINIREEASLPPIEEPLNDNLVVFIPTEREKTIQIVLLNRNKGIILLNEEEKSRDENKIVEVVNSFLFLQKTPEDVRFFGKDILPFALRWLRLNHKRINFIKQGDFSSRKEMNSQILKYIKGKFKDKVFLY